MCKSEHSISHQSYIWRRTMCVSRDLFVGLQNRISCQSIMERWCSLKEDVACYWLLEDERRWALQTRKRSLPIYCAWLNIIWLMFFFRLKHKKINDFCYFNRCIFLSFLWTNATVQILACQVELLLPKGQFRFFSPNLSVF